MQPDNQYRYNPLLLGKAPNLESKKIYLDDDQLKGGAIYIVLSSGTSNRYPLFLHKPTNKLLGGKYHVFCSPQELSDIHKAIVQHAQPVGYIDTKADMYMSSPNPIPVSLYDGIPNSYWAAAYENGSRVHREQRHVEELKARNEI